MLNLMRHLVLYKYVPRVKLTYDLSSNASHFFTATYISKHLFLRHHWAVSYGVYMEYNNINMIFVLGHLTKMAIMRIYGKTKYDKPKSLS